MARFIMTFNNRVLGNHQVVEGSPVTIGRHPDNHIIIDNKTVSAHHARIESRGRKMVITDLGSRNGTLVNNEKIKEAALSHQDWVTIGKHIIIVDLHESLPLEATADQLIARPEMNESEGTMMLEHDEHQSTWVGFDYLFFLSSRREDLELTHQIVTIGKNPDADIRVTGLCSFFAGAPSATIEKHHDGYTLTHVGGLTKVRVNGTPISEPFKLKHQDTVKIGPVEFQIRFVRRPSH
jgi:pSer/pThr/pTyr-binding forkhead associated (FHA) protein